jgi:hypothetical protein
VAPEAIYVESRRELARYGITTKAANRLVGLLREFTASGSDRKTEDRLRLQSFKVMENMKVSKGMLRVKNNRLVWIRRKGWAKA